MAFWTVVMSLLAMMTFHKIHAGPPGETLWGKRLDFMEFECKYWELAVSIPPLQELSVCVSLNRSISTPKWTVFMYSRHVGGPVDIGLEGNDKNLYVWLFGEQWRARFSVHLKVQYSVCITWSEFARSPHLYVNGSPVEISFVKPKPKASLEHNLLSSQGCLTLGASHFIVNDEIQVETGTEFQGSLTLFRMWKQALEASQLQHCIDGDLVRWSLRDWVTHDCAPVSDDHFQCVWSLFAVRMNVNIYRWDALGDDAYIARDLVHSWVRKVLPSNMYIHAVSVSALLRPFTIGNNSIPRAMNRKFVEGVPILNRFKCSVYLNVIPGEDVSLVQHIVSVRLQSQYESMDSLLSPINSSIYVSPVGSFPVVTIQPPLEMSTSTPSTTPSTESITTASSTGSNRPPPVIVITSHANSSQSSTPVTALTTSSTSVTSGPPSDRTTGPSSSPGSSSLSPKPTTEGVVSEIFFRVDLSVTLKGSSLNAEQKINAWINETLSKEKMSVLNFQFLGKSHSLKPFDNGSRGSEQTSLASQSSHTCRFQVLANTSSSIEQTTVQIRNSLEVPYSHGHDSLDAEPEEILVSHIEPGQCPRQQQQTRQGLFVWSETSAQHTASYPCQGDTEKTGHRQCLLASNHKAQWARSDTHHCPFVVATIPDLDDIDVTAENAMDVLGMIECLLSDHTKLNDQELVTILKKLSDVVNVTKVTPTLGKVLVEILSDILQSDSNFQPVINNILRIIENIGDKLSGFCGDNFSLTAPGLAISVVSVDPDNFHNLTFGVSSPTHGQTPAVYINQEPFDCTVAFISLPPSLQSSFPSGQGAQPRIQFQFFGTTALFDHENQDRLLNTFVVSASVTNATGPIQGLKEPVVVTLHHLKDKKPENDVLCVFWNFSLKNENGGLGGWDTRGCYLQNTSFDHTTCHCNHLTHFGVLLDLSGTPIDETNDKILTIISQVGCGVSAVFLGVTIVTYTVFEKLRRDHPSKILLNLTLALEGLNLVFLLNPWLSSLGSSVLCVGVAVSMHYFLLASFTWMGLEGVHMYFALVKVFNVYVPSYILKFCALGWGIPLFVCGLVLIVRREAYGSAPYGVTLEPTDEMFCWVQDDLTFYVSVVGYILLLLLGNMAVFLVVLVQLRSMRFKGPAGTRRDLLKDLRGVASLTILLGLTWIVAFFAWGPVKVLLLYLFSILNSLQGFFLFIFYCLLKENVRKQWRAHFCCGRFRLQDYSDWSQTATVPARPKASQPVKFPSVKSVRSSATESTSASSDSSQRDVSIKRPNLGLLCLNGLLNLPRAQPDQSAPVHRNTPLPQDHGYCLSPWPGKDGPHLDSDNRVN